VNKAFNRKSASSKKNEKLTNVQSKKKLEKLCNKISEKRQRK